MDKQGFMITCGNCGRPNVYGSIRHTKECLQWQNAVLKQQHADLVKVVQGLIDFEDTALMDDHVPSELIENAKQIIAQVKGDQS